MGQHILWVNLQYTLRETRTLFTFVCVDILGRLLTPITFPATKAKKFMPFLKLQDKLNVYRATFFKVSSSLDHLLGDMKITSDISENKPPFLQYLTLFLVLRAKTQLDLPTGVFNCSWGIPFHRRLKRLNICQIAIIVVITVGVRLKRTSMATEDYCVG